MLKRQENHKFLLSVSPGKKMGNRARLRKKYLTSVGVEPTTPGFYRPLLYRLTATRPDESKSWVIVLVIAAM